MKTELSAAVVGTGFIGPVHVEGLRRAGVRVAGIVGSSLEKGRVAAHRLGLARAYGSLDEVLADDSVDVVHLATPNRYHFDQAAAALRAGKHVLCEKPLAMNSRESAEMVRIAAISGRAAGVAYNIRFYPLCHEAAARVRNGFIGDVLHVTGSYVQDWLLFPTDFNWRVLAEEGGELRSAADVGSHWLDLMQFITGCRVVAMCADLRTVHPTRQRPQGGAETFSDKASTSAQNQTVEITTDDSACVMLRFDNGANGCLWTSQTTAGRKNCLRFEVAGSRQSLAWDSEQSDHLWIGHRDRPNELLIRDPALMSSSAQEICGYPGGHGEGYPDTFKHLFRNFYRYIAAGDFSTPSHFPTFDDGHRDMLLCEAVLQSHREQRWITLGDEP